jgi:hypothetical protein
MVILIPAEVVLVVLVVAPEVVVAQAEAGKVSLVVHPKFLYTLNFYTP